MTADGNRLIGQDGSVGVRLVVRGPVVGAV
jgi:hypothetical protein